MVNVELLEKVMTFIKDHPDRHNQAVWATECGTSACFAGWTILLSGGQYERLREYGNYGFTLNGELVSPEERAAEMLGISREDAAAMFLYTYTREALELEVKDLINHGKLYDAGRPDRVGSHYETEAHG
jgi:hypothetical protein